MQYRCYLEECVTLSQTPATRRDHCITEHKFPPDFRFDCYSRPKKGSHKSDNKNGNNSKQSCVLEPSKLVSVTTHDEDIELENKSILLTAQRKHFTNFSFGHKKSKTFQRSTGSSSGGGGQSYAKQLTAKSEITKKPQSVLDNQQLVDELMESLPQ